MINRLTTTVWPTITKAILDLVITGDVYNTVLYPQLKAQVFDKVGVCRVGGWRGSCWRQQRTAFKVLPLGYYQGGGRP